MAKKPHTDYDSPWKEMLEKYFEECLSFFFPEIHDDIDWQKGYEFLDKELQKVVRGAKTGRRLVDKLIKVWRNDGAETWVLIHIEVQGQVEEEFPERLYIYNYRLFDRYKKRVATLAILTDNQSEWRPQRFEYTLWGCEVSLKFPVMKLLDYESRLHELQQHPNPFAVVVFAHLKTLATHDKPHLRFQSKLQLFRMLYERGYSKEDILELARFIDWIMILPDDLEQQLMEVVDQYEEASKMRYVTSFERIGMKRGMEKGMQEGMQQGLQQGMQQGMQQGALKTSHDDIIEILKARFGFVPASIITAVNMQEDMLSLKALLKKAAIVESLDTFQCALKSKN